MYINYDNYLKLTSVVNYLKSKKKKSFMVVVFSLHEFDPKNKKKTCLLHFILYHDKIQECPIMVTPIYF